MGGVLSARPKQDGESALQAMAAVEPVFEFCQKTLGVLRVKRMIGATTITLLC